MPMQFGMLKRLRVPEFAQSCSPVVALFEPDRQRIGPVLVLLMLLCCPAQQSYGAESLECPEIGSSSVPDLIGDVSGGGLFATENRVDLVNRSTRRSTGCKPPAPISHGFTAAEKWSRMHQYDNVLERQIAANMMPAGTLIIANVPLPPDVFRELRRQAAVSNQTPAQLMTAILTRAVGR
jgi:hypothetical protein